MGQVNCTNLSARHLGLAMGFLHAHQLQEPHDTKSCCGIFAYYGRCISHYSDKIHSLVHLQVILPLLNLYIRVAGLLRFRLEHCLFLNNILHLLMNGKFMQYPTFTKEMMCRYLFVHMWC